MLNAIEKLYTDTGCVEETVKQFASFDEVLEHYNYDLVALFTDVLSEHIAQGTEIENEYHAIERTRPLTEEENAEANDRLFPIRREVVRAGEALRAARKFQTITASTGMSAN